MFYSFINISNFSNNFSTSELVAADFNQVLTDILLSLETVGIDVINNTSDSIPVSDTGNILDLTDYAETYFAEDYVGTVVETF